jgi:hypothetical protein
LILDCRAARELTRAFEGAMDRIPQAIAAALRARSRA